MNIIHQASQIFVFEDSEDVQSENNGTLNLLARLKEHQIADTKIMHAIRKEFLKKVFAGYIRQIPVKSNVKYDSDAKEDAGYGSSGPETIGEDKFGITTTADRKNV